MKVIIFLVVVLNIESVYPQRKSSYPVHRVTNESLWGPELRIYGGDVAEEGQFPFMIMVLLFTPYETGRCSASLIKPDWVLTAAHCVDKTNLKPSDIILAGGKANLIHYLRKIMKNGPSTEYGENIFGVQERQAGEFIIHPEYSSNSETHDLALIRVKKPFDSPAIKTIPLSKVKMMEPKYCTILGWGWTRGNQLNSNLNFAHYKLALTTSLGCKIKKEGPFICLQPSDSGICSGDSGGPLVCDNMVWGVASHYYYENSEDCGDSIEEYYSEIYPDLDWIIKKSGGNSSVVISMKNMFVCALIGLWFSKDIYKI